MTDAEALILLIDDNEDLREATRETLESLGFEVLTVTSPAGLEEISSDLVADVDLLVVHAYMHGEWGLAALDRLRSVNPDLPAIVMSGFGEDETMRRQTAEGKFGFLVVPYTFDHLAAMVREALTGRAGFVPPRIGRRVAAQRETRLQAEKVEEADSPAPAPGRSRSLARRSLGLVWCYAAIAILALAAVVVYQAVGARPPALPDFAPQEVFRGSEVLLVAPLGEIGEPPLEFEWQEFDGAVQYRLTLTAVDERVLWEAESRGSRVALTSELAQRLHRAVEYSWVVEALNAAGVKVGRSQRASFRVRPRGD